MTHPLPDKPYRLKDGEIVDAEGRRITISGLAAVVQLLNERDQLKRALDKQIELASAPSAIGAPETAVRNALFSNDLYSVLMDVQNGIDSPGLRMMANNAIQKVDKARRELSASTDGSADCTEPDRKRCPRSCEDFCNEAEERKAAGR